MTTTPRPSKDEYMLMLAVVASKRSTCRHRQQGTVLARDYRVISAGYNGSPPGAVHCTDVDRDCIKEHGAPCRAEGLHGESNAIATAAKLGISTDGASMFSVYSPCLPCCNLMLTAGIKELVYWKVYENYPEGPKYLKTMGIDVRQVHI